MTCSNDGDSDEFNMNIIDDYVEDPLITDNTNLVRDFTVLNTNARLLCPKITSLIDTMEETGAVMSVVSETWLKDGEGLDNDRDDLREGAGMELICKNRQVNERGVAHGGVAIMYRKSAVSLRELRVDTATDYEILVALGNIKGLSRKILVIACYVPPCLLYTSPSPRDS